MKKDILSSLFENEKPEDIAEKVMKNHDLLPKLTLGLSSKNPRVKFGSAKTLRIISEKNPKMLYSKIDFFFNLLDSENNILKWNAIDIIANLAAADSLNKFNKLFKKFYNHLREGSLITAGHIVDSSGKIALSKPELKDTITEELLAVEEIPLPTDECKNILIGKTINAFSAYYNKIENKERVLIFVERQLKNSRTSTKAKAEKFLKKFQKQ